MSLKDNGEIKELKKILDECSYNPFKKESIANDIMSVLNYKKNTERK